MDIYIYRLAVRRRTNQHVEVSTCMSRGVDRMLAQALNTGQVEVHKVQVEADEAQVEVHKPQVRSELQDLVCALPREVRGN